MPCCSRSTRGSQEAVCHHVLLLVLSAGVILPPPTDASIRGGQGQRAQVAAWSEGRRPWGDGAARRNLCCSGRVQPTGSAVVRAMQVPAWSDGRDDSASAGTGRGCEVARHTASAPRCCRHGSRNHARRPLAPLQAALVRLVFLLCSCFAADDAPHLLGKTAAALLWRPRHASRPADRVKQAEMQISNYAIRVRNCSPASRV